MILGVIILYFAFLIGLAIYNVTHQAKENSVIGGRQVGFFFGLFFTDSFHNFWWNCIPALCSAVVIGAGIVLEKIPLKIKAA